MSGTFYGCYLLRPVILRRLIWATTASKMQLDEFSIVSQNTHQPAHPFRYLVLVFKIFLAPTRGPTPFEVFHVHPSSGDRCNSSSDFSGGT